jgi:hypothetical protein
MKTIFKFLVVILLFSCNEKSQKSLAYNSNDLEENAIHVEMENKTFGIQQKNLEPIKKTLFKKDSILLIFWEDDNPLKLNFNLFNTDILDTGSATYTIPDVNAKKQMVDLNFYNKDRDVKSTNRRIIFKKGTITITKLTDHQLQMTFEGEGSGIMEYNKTFPISGKVDVNY